MGIKIKWEDVLIDTPIVVQTDVDSTMLAHFAGLRDEGNGPTPSFWVDGRTSWTTNKFMIYSGCRLPFKGEAEIFKIRALHSKPTVLFKD